MAEHPVTPASTAAEPPAVEQTLAVIKSGATSRGQADAILERAEAAGLAVVARATGQVSRLCWERFYAEHAGRDYFERLVGSVTGPDGVVVAILEGEGAVRRWRALLGPTDPEQAPPGTIRGDFGVRLPDNAAHGSDSPESAAREITLMTGFVHPADPKPAVDWAAQPAPGAHLDPWCVVEIDGAEHLFGFALSHAATGGRSWTRSSPIVDLDEAAGRARTESGRVYALGQRIDPDRITDEEGFVALEVLVGGPQRVADGASVTGVVPLHVLWLTARKMARHLGVAPPSRAEADVRAFMDAHEAAYLRAMGRLPDLH